MPLPAQVSQAGVGNLVPMSDTLTTTPVQDPDVVDTDEGDHDRFSHYVRKADIMRSAVEGVAVQALCGKKWIPNRNPDRYPVCPTCKEIFQQLNKG